MSGPADDQPTPIAFCITELDRGGAERALTHLVLGLDRRAWTPRVYSLGSRGHFTELLEAGGIAVESFQARGIASIPRVLRQLTRSLKQFRPAVLQTFLFHGNMLGRLAARRARVPVVVSGIRVAERRSAWYGRLDRWTNWLVDHNVCVSQGVAQFSIRNTGLQPCKVSVIPNGVDVETFARATPADLSALGLRPSDPVIITIGRLEEQKGIHDLLSAIPAVLHRHSNSQFLIVGAGRDRAALQQQASSLGITSAVTFAGSQSDIPGLLKASTLFVLPSLWEGMPNALLEAMASGRPVIATSVEGSAELIQSGVTGSLVPPSCPNDLAAAINALLADPHVARRYADASQIFVMNDFTIHNLVARYDGLYRRLLAQR